MKSQSQLRVGLIGAGEVAQVIHLPVLALLSHLYKTTVICDLSKTVSLPHTLRLIGEAKLIGCLEH